MLMSTLSVPALIVPFYAGKHIDKANKSGVIFFLTLSLIGTTHNLYFIFMLI